jgi:sugar phosphate permease
MEPAKETHEVVSSLDKEAKLPADAWLEYRATDKKPGGVIDTYRSYSPEFAKQTEKKLLRRIDRRILPLMVLIYLFNYLDRNSITQARLYGLQEDTHVTGAVYNTAIAIFSAGYIAMQLPATLMIAKARPSIFLVCLLMCNSVSKYWTNLYGSQR